MAFPPPITSFKNKETFTVLSSNFSEKVEVDESVFGGESTSGTDVGLIEINE